MITVNKVKSQVEQDMAFCIQVITVVIIVVIIAMKIKTDHKFIHTILDPLIIPQTLHIDTELSDLMFEIITKSGLLTTERCRILGLPIPKDYLKNMVRIK